MLIHERMNRTLIGLAVVILLGWTTLAAGVIAVLQGAPEVATHAHRHRVPDEQVNTADSGVNVPSWPESLEQHADQPDGFRPVQLRVEPAAVPI